MIEKSCRLRIACNIVTIFLLNLLIVNNNNFYSSFNFLPTNFFSNKFYQKMHYLTTMTIVKINKKTSC